MSENSGSSHSGCRHSKRIALKLNLLDNLKTVLGGKAIGCISRDISVNGLGIVCFEKIGIDKVFVLKFPAQNKMVLLETRWCRRDQDRTEIFHVGLSLDQHSVNLLDLFIRESLLTGKHLLKPFCELKPRTSLTFADIKKMITVLHLPDQRLLRQIDLEFLKNSHLAFQKRHQETSFLIVLRRDISAMNTDALKPGDAAIKILIFEASVTQEAKKWSRVWPDQSLISDRMLHQAIKKDLNEDPFVIISGARERQILEIETEF